MDNILELIVTHAQAHQLEPELVYAVCRQESSLNPVAVRHEPDYRWVYRPKDVKPRWCSLDTERMLQKTSFGLMQVMGAVFREYGFEGWLSEVICCPTIQLEYGCRHLERKISKWGKLDGVAAYNAGSPRRNPDGKLVNQYYVDNVMRFASIAVATGLLPDIKK